MFVTDRVTTLGGLAALIVVKQETQYLRVIPKENLIFQNAHTMQTQFQTTLDNAPVNVSVVLDLEEITVVDSMGLKLIVGLLKSCQEQGRTFSIENALPHIAQVFKLCGLNDHFSFTVKGMD